MLTPYSCVHTGGKCCLNRISKISFIHHKSHEICSILTLYLLCEQQIKKVRVLIPMYSFIQLQKVDEFIHSKNLKTVKFCAFITDWLKLIQVSINVPHPCIARYPRRQRELLRCVDEWRWRCSKCHKKKKTFEKFNSNVPLRNEDLICQDNPQCEHFQVGAIFFLCHHLQKVCTRMRG